MLIHAPVPSKFILGEHSAFSQTHPMAVLFIDGSNDKTPEHQIRGHRTLDGSAGVSERRIIRGYRTVDLERARRTKRPSCI